MERRGPEEAVRAPVCIRRDAVARSFIEFGGKGIWDSDGAIRDLLALLLVELEARGLRRKQAELWEYWTLQAYVILTGTSAPGLRSRGR
jgi:hypothetical protein